MAEFTVNYSALRRPSETYDGSGYKEPDYELGEASWSRTPSYASNPASVFRANDDDEALIKQERTTSVAESLNTNDTKLKARTSTTRSSREKRRKLQGWKFGVAASTAMTAAVLLTNLILTIWASTKFHPVGGVGTAYDGDCNVVNRWALGLHILINALSSALLSASSYCMQVSSAPTRRECDAAHKAGDWCDIGVAGTRNLSRISRSRTLVWTLLALSSIPIHLLYNSAIFKTIGANSYKVVVANKDFLKGGNYSIEFAGPTTYPLDGVVNKWYLSNEVGWNASLAVRDAYTANSSAFETLSGADCIAAYGTAFVSRYSNVILISDYPSNSSNNSVLYATSVTAGAGDPSNAPYDWICLDTRSSNSCDLGKAKKNAEQWMMSDHKVDRCLAEVTEPHCKLQFSVGILAAVIVCGVLKSIAMLYTLYRHREEPLVTIGDAIASYLDVPDELTRSRCLTGKADINQGPLKWRNGTKGRFERSTLEPPLMLMKRAPRLYNWLSSLRLGRKTLSLDFPGPDTKPPAVPYQSVQPKRWFVAVSYKRWLITLGLCIIALSITGNLLQRAVVALIRTTGESVTSLGFGAVDSRAMINFPWTSSGTSGLVAAVLIANSPQAILSFLYLAYNGLYTCMHLSFEYSKYAVRRRPLRVTTPHGEQRSTYYLQLPFTYGVPLIIISATMHWLVSEAIFLARISVYNDSYEDSDISAVGYSIAPIIVIIVFGTSMLAVAVGMGFRKFASNIPAAGSCSAAIAAACHRPKADEDAAVLPVMWGEVVGPDSHDGEVGHCCFTSEEVREPVAGKLYAGSRESEDVMAIRHRTVDPAVRVRR